MSVTVEETEWVPSRCETDPSEECQYDPQCVFYAQPKGCRHDKRRSGTQDGTAGGPQQ